MFVKNCICYPTLFICVFNSHRPEEMALTERGEQERGEEGEGGGEGAKGKGGVEDAGVRRTRLSGVDEPDKIKVREG